jgi:hypothetical protein
MVATLVAAVCVSSSALADEFDPWFAASRAGGYVDVWPAESFTGVLFGAELQLRVAKRVFLDISISGAAAEHDSLIGSDDIELAYANPTIGAHYAGDVTRNFHFFVGGTLTPPFLHDPDGSVAAAAITTAGIRGYYDLDRLLPGHMAVRAMAGFEWNFVEPLYLRAELRPVVYIPTRNSIFGIDGRNEADLLIEHAAEFEGRFRNGFGMGLRLQAVALPTIDAPGADQAQVVFEPFLTVTPKRKGFFMRLGFPIALDSPLGWGLDTNKLAAGRIHLGGQW